MEDGGDPDARTEVFGIGRNGEQGLDRLPAIIPFLFLVPFFPLVFDFQSPQWPGQTERGVLLQLVAGQDRHWFSNCFRLFRFFCSFACSTSKE